MYVIPRSVGNKSGNVQPSWPSAIPGPSLGRPEIAEENDKIAYGRLAGTFRLTRGLSTLGTGAHDTYELCRSASAASWTQVPPRQSTAIAAGQHPFTSHHLFGLLKLLQSTRNSRVARVNQRLEGCGSQMHKVRLQLSLNSWCQ